MSRHDEEKSIVRGVRKHHSTKTKPGAGQATAADGDAIVVRGARMHNLKNVTVSMPRNKMIVFTGLSGSGKSSLAFDTIFAEGQRRYVESLSAYARQFINQMGKPDVDEIVGLSPAISIDQKSRSNNPRSTVATITEIYDYLRIFFARVGLPHCLECGRPIRRLSNEEIKKLVLARVRKHTGKVRETVEIRAPIVRGRKGEYYQELYDFLSKGFERAVVDGARVSLRERVVLEKQKKHTIDILVDTIALGDFRADAKGAGERLSEAIELALREASGLVRIVYSDPSLNEAGDPAPKKGGSSRKPKRTEEEGLLVSTRFTCPYDGYSYPEIEPRLFSFNSPYGACPECNGLGTKHFFGSEPCETCDGARLRPEALHVTIGGQNIVGVTARSIQDVQDFFANLELTKKEQEISQAVVREIVERLQFMIDVGIEYLTLDRRANTLSGGEAQRIRLASQLGSRLVGTLYVLDEPTIGLHQRDNDRLIDTLVSLRDLGNTIIIVEHDEDTIFASDYIVDIGPGAGVHGGEIVVADDLEKLLVAKTPKNNSLTLRYLRGEESIPIPEKRRSAHKGTLKIHGASKFNIINQNIDIPLNKFVCVTGVSGSGKSTLLYEVLHKNLQKRFDRKYRSNDLEHVSSMTGTEYLSRSILIDQSPIGRTSRSNPATYTGAFGPIRDLFASTNEARSRGWRAGRFSFNVRGGRCEACEGKGDVAVEMHFLPTVYVRCDVCNGTRFMQETLEVTYKGKNIHEVLSMTVEEAVEFFKDIPAVYDRLKTLNDTGLGYLTLGQPAPTLSGGESQRVKISSELYRPDTVRTIYLLDEPTVGLHYEDVKKLIEILQKLVERGNTVVLIEHNMDIVKSADHIIDLGPEGGERGGRVVVTGTPEEVAGSGKGYTAAYLKKHLKK